MYSKIWNPYKLEFVSTFSIEGKKAIKAYVNSYMTGGASGNEKAEALKAAAAAATAAADSIRLVGEKLIGDKSKYPESVDEMRKSNDELLKKLDKISMEDFKQKIAEAFQKALTDGKYSDKLYHNPKRRIIIDPTFGGKSLIENPEDKTQPYILQVYKIKEDKDDSMKAGYHDNEVRLPGLDETGGPSDLRLNPGDLSQKITELKSKTVDFDKLMTQLKYNEIFKQDEVQKLKDYKYYKVDKSMNKLSESADKVEYYFHEERGKEPGKDYKAYLLTGPEVKELVGGDTYVRGWAPNISYTDTEQLGKAVTKIPLNDDGTLNVDRINTDFSDVLLKIYENDKVSA